MKKKALFAFAAVFLAMAFSGCGESNSEEAQTSAVPVETALLETSVTTEFIPEPEQEEKEEAKSFMLGIYDPFENSQKADSADIEELRDAAAKIARELMIMGGYADFVNYPDGNALRFYDESSPLEVNEEEEYSFCPVDPFYAEDEDTLFARVRSAFTANYISDEEIKSRLFKDEKGPAYKTIDGVLCARVQYLGVPPRINANEIANIGYYDGKTAEIVVSAYDVAEPMWYVFMKLKKSEKDGWQLDSIEYKNYYKYEMKMLYNALYLRQEKINAILGGGNLSGDKVTVGGEEYMRTDLNMTLDEMRGYFSEIFREKELISDKEHLEAYNKGLLREPMISKYIDDVYCELDGALYRRVSAPEWYLPELRMDPYSGPSESRGGTCPEDYIIMEQPFFDSETGESFTRQVAIAFKNESYDENALCKFLYIASELPVRKKGGGIYVSPVEAAEAFLEEMRGGEDVLSLEINSLKVPQVSGGLAKARYGESTEPDVRITLVLADYSIEHASSSGKESGEVSEWIAFMSSPEKGFYFYDRFPNEPHTFTGTASEVLEDHVFTVVPDEGSPELEIAESFTMQVYPVPAAPPEKAGDRVKVTYNGEITLDENGAPRIEIINVCAADPL